MIKRFFVFFIVLLSSVFVSAQIPAGFVQTVATVGFLQNGSFNASWMNLSGQSQLPLLGGVSSFQTVVVGNFDSFGHMSTLLADTSQVLPTPSTWIFNINFSCPGSSSPLSYTVSIAITGGGSIEDISNQLSSNAPVCSGIPITTTTPGNLNVSTFGATGSQQTMNCNTTIGNVLTGCSGGDFKVGNYIFIPAAGVSPTIFAPASPTVTCGSDNSGSCTGSTIYGYKIVAIQGYPNGPMTAASTAGTVTQNNQTSKSPVSASRPDVYTIVSWNSVANASLYAIYKSINSGSYNFLTLVSSSVTSIKDFGSVAQVDFTCIDIGIPCIAPSSSIANDVFAKITSINGSTVLYSGYSNQPKYTSQAGLPSSTFPSSASISIPVTVQHDDTPAFFAAYQAALALGGNSTINIAPGNFNLHNANPYGLPASFIINKLINIDLIGSGSGTSLFQSNDRSGLNGAFLNSVCGFQSISPPNNCAGSGYIGEGGAGATYNIVDPTPSGSNAVTLSTPSDSSNFSVGTYVNIYDSSVVYPGEMYGELNKVTAVNAATGVLALAYPTNKPYASNLPVPFNVCSSCAATPKVSPIINGPIAVGVSLKNFNYRGANTFVRSNTIDGMVEKGLNVTASQLYLQGVTRHVLLEGNQYIEDTFWEEGPSYMTTAAAGSGDIQILNNKYQNGHTSFPGQICSEGSANIMWANNSMLFNGHGDINTGSYPSDLLTMDTCYGFTFQSNQVTVASGNWNGIIAFQPTFGTVISDNTFNIDTIGSTGSTATVLDPTGTGFGSSQVQVGGNYWNISATSGNVSYISVNGSLSPIAYNNFPLSGVSGSVQLFPYYGGTSTISMTLSGNITAISIGSNRHAGYYFALIFTQPSVGGPFTLPSLISSWTPNNIDFLQGIAPAINPAAGSSTIVWFYDDGAIVHEISDNYSQNSFGSPVSITNGSTSPLLNGLYTNTGFAVLDQFLATIGGGNEVCRSVGQSGNGTNDVVYLCEHWANFNNAGTYASIGFKGNLDLLRVYTNGDISNGSDCLIALCITGDIFASGLLRTGQTPTSSSTASNFSVPIVLNGATFYIRLSSTP